jgi:copper transporter 1
MSMPSMTSAAAMATSSTMAGMAGMMGSMDGTMGACQMEMAWNWFTIGACFMSTSWQITSNGMFAGTCIGVILLVMAVEFTRRAGREYDRTIVRQWKEAMMNGDKITAGSGSSNQSQVAEVGDGKKMLVTRLLFSPNTSSRTFKPTVLQQLIRALSYMVQLGGAYIIMLLIMYYNGYIFFCVLIGGLLGFFFFGADSIVDGLHQQSADACC